MLAAASSLAVGVLGVAVATVVAPSRRRAPSWVDAVAETTPDLDDETDDTMAVLREGVVKTAIAWFGLAALVRAGCHAWGRLVVNAYRHRRGQIVLESTRALDVRPGFGAVHADVASDVLGRVLAFAAGVLFLMALPAEPVSRPFLGVIYGSQGGYLLADLVVGSLYLAR